MTQPLLLLPANVDCPECDLIFPVLWKDDSLSIEDMTEPPVTDVVCPGCGHIIRDMEWPGWMFRSEAG